MQPKCKEYSACPEKHLFIKTIFCIVTPVWVQVLKKYFKKRGKVDFCPLMRLRGEGFHTLTASTDKPIIKQLITYTLNKVGTYFYRKLIVKIRYFCYAYLKKFSSLMFRTSWWISPSSTSSTWRIMPGSSIHLYLSIHLSIHSSIHSFIHVSGSGSDLKSKKITTFFL